MLSHPELSDHKGLTQILHSVPFYGAREIGMLNELELGELTQLTCELLWHMLIPCNLFLRKLVIVQCVPRSSHFYLTIKETTWWPSTGSIQVALPL